MLKAEDADVGRIILMLTLFYFYSYKLISQDIPESELKVMINSYFDNFGVTVIYPTIDYNRQLGKNTSISGRYVTDVISAASMHSKFFVDGLTSATSRTQGGAVHTPDEWRHELGVGFKQRIFQNVFSMNGSYSIEHDYSSKTFLASLDIPFAKKNTVLNLSVSGSFDKVFPVIWTWTKDRNTLTLSGALTQIFAKNVISQLDASYSDVTGYMLDGYQVVRIISGNTVLTLEPIEPDKRIRRAVGLRTNIGVTKKVTLQLGYRYYWDTWDIQSHTASVILSKNFSETFSGSLELRHYIQTRAFFFKPVYDVPEEYMSVDSKLNSGYSDNINVTLSLKGKHGSGFLTNEKLQLVGSAGFYLRHYDSPDWHADLNNLIAALLSIGIRYHF